MAYSVGIGLTNACNLRCAHCYRPTDRIDYMPLDQIKTICESIPVEGRGTGENILHPQFNAIVEYLRERNVKLSIATNGHSLMTMSAEHLAVFNDVEVSVDYASPAQQDGLRGPGNWALDGNLQGHDEHCPWARGETIDLPWEAAPDMNFVRGRNVCTTIVV